MNAFLRDETFRGDIVLLEARETDAQFFDLSPLTFWKREAAVQHGLTSVRRTLSDEAERLAPVFARCGLDFRPPTARPGATRSSASWVVDPPRVPVRPPGPGPPGYVRLRLTARSGPPGPPTVPNLRPSLRCCR